MNKALQWILRWDRFPRSRMNVQNLRSPASERTRKTMRNEEAEASAGRQSGQQQELRGKWVWTWVCGLPGSEVRQVTDIQSTVGVGNMWRGNNLPAWTTPALHSTRAVGRLVQDGKPLRVRLWCPAAGQLGFSPLFANGSVRPSCWGADGRHSSSHTYTHRQETIWQLTEQTGGYKTIYRNAHLTPSAISYYKHHPFPHYTLSSWPLRNDTPLPWKHMLSDLSDAICRFNCAPSHLGPSGKFDHCCKSVHKV